MPNTKHFKYLEKRIAELCGHMLPVFSPTGDYSEGERDHTRGFRVLAHAEIEAYLETLSTETIDNKISQWNKSGKANHILICFLAAYHRGWVTDETGLPIFHPKPGVKPQDTIANAINAANSQFKDEVIAKNNGIKISNLKSLFLPIGVDFSTLDDTWLNTVNSFGRQRGEVAHQSKKMQKQIDPKSEFDKVYYVLNGIKILDEIVVGLRK